MNCGRRWSEALWFRCAVIFGIFGCIVVMGGCKRSTPPPQKRPLTRTQVQPLPRYRLPPGIKIYPEEVLIRPNQFWMGVTKKELKSAVRERPRHRVKLLRNFVLWRHEITQDQFKKWTGYNPSYFKNCGGHCPVENVTWHEAAYFCNKLSQKRGLAKCYRCRNEGRQVTCLPTSGFAGSYHYRCPGYRLPTEAEWEYASRIPAPKSSPTSTKLDDIGWFAKNSQATYTGAFTCRRDKGSKDKTPSSQHCGPQPVAQKAPNSWGLRDMIGNVSEWVFDTYADYKPFPETEPGGGTQGLHLYRGCNWFSFEKECHPAIRFPASPARRNQLIGFRPARTLGIFVIR